jgi:DNA-binding transcriptional regulator YhcF (GntR family)
MAQMLGVTRPTVNIAGATLQRAGFITYTRGRITVIDREGLESASCECYQRIRDELDGALNGENPGSPRSRLAQKT